VRVYAAARMCVTTSPQKPAGHRPEPQLESKAASFVAWLNLP